MMRQCGFISGNKHATGERDVDKGEACVCVWGAERIWEISVPSFQ